MRFVPAIRVLLALLVALLLPLEQARCACAAMQRQAAAQPAASSTLHACCAAKAAAASRKAAAPHSCATGGCSCQKAPAEASASVTLAPASESVAYAPLTLALLCTLLAPEAAVLTTAPAPDVGGPPLAESSLAHGLRAPPAIA